MREKAKSRTEMVIVLKALKEILREEDDQSTQKVLLSIIATLNWTAGIEVRDVIEAADPDDIGDLPHQLIIGWIRLFDMAIKECAMERN